MPPNPSFHRTLRDEAAQRPVDSDVRPHMNSRITLRKIWNDDDIIELTVEVSDGKSMFANNVYVAINAIQIE